MKCCVACLLTQWLADLSVLPLFVLFKVVGMSSVAVGSFDDIQQWIDQGNKKRSIAATKMNETSRCQLVDKYCHFSL